MQRIHEAVQIRVRAEFFHLREDEARIRIAFLLQGAIEATAAFCQPQHGLQLRGFAQGRCIRFLNRPTSGFQALSGITQRGLHFGLNLHSIRRKAKGRALRRRRAFHSGIHPPGVANVARAHGAESELHIGDAARQRPADRHDLPANMTFRTRSIPGWNAPKRWAQPVNTAGIGGVTDGTANIRAVTNCADAGHGRGRRTARRTTRRNAGITRVFRVTMQRIAREPAERKGRRVGPPDNHRARLAQIGHHGIILLRDQILLQT